MIFLQVEFGLKREGVEREGGDDDAEDEFDDVIVDSGSVYRNRNPGRRSAWPGLT